MESVCQIKQLLQARTPIAELEAVQSDSQNTFDWQRSLRLLEVPHKYSSATRGGVGGPGKSAQAWWSVKSCSDIPLPPRPTHSFFPLKIACELNIRKCAQLSSTTAPSTEAVNHTCTSQQCPFVRLCPLKSRTEESPEDLQREIRLRR